MVISHITSRRELLNDGGVEEDERRIGCRTWRGTVGEVKRDEMSDRQ